MSWTKKDQEILYELNSNKIDICAIAELKKKGKAKQEIEDYIFIYSGVNHEKRAHSGVGMLIHKKYKQSIEQEQYISDRLLQVTINAKGERIQLLSVYASDISKEREERENF